MVDFDGSQLVLGPDALAARVYGARFGGVAGIVVRELEQVDGPITLHTRETCTAANLVVPLVSISSGGGGGSGSGSTSKCTSSSHSACICTRSPLVRMLASDFVVPRLTVHVHVQVHFGQLGVAQRLEFDGRVGGTFLDSIAVHIIIIISIGKVVVVLVLRHLLMLLLLLFFLLLLAILPRLGIFIVIGVGWKRVAALGAVERNHGSGREYKLRVVVRVDGIEWNGMYWKGSGTVQSDCALRRIIT